MSCGFNLYHLEEIFEEAKSKYKIIRCLDYDVMKNISKKLLINRIDIDLDLKMAKSIYHIFNKLGIKATYFVRLHGPYNPFSIENLNFLYELVRNGNEIGYHSEVLDCSNLLSIGVPSSDIVRADLSTFSNFFIGIWGVASHRDATMYNNQDFWNINELSKFGLEYDAYGEMFFDSFYVSDSDITNWKCYDKGKLVTGDNRCLCQHIKEEHKILYSLIFIVFYHRIR